jgi:hypothetical protein
MRLKSSSDAAKKKEKPLFPSRNRLTIQQFSGA